MAVNANVRDWPVSSKKVVMYGRPLLGKVHFGVTAWVWSGHVFGL
jgi:hypothetical protein